MARRTDASFVLALACAFAPGSSWAQEVTGALVATVEDSQGGALRGASVRVSSPALIGGPQLSITTATGQLRFPALPPGVYWLEVELMGFRCTAKRAYAWTAPRGKARHVSPGVRESLYGCDVGPVHCATVSSRRRDAKR